MENFLNTTLRNIAWFKNANDKKELDIKPPFQRNPVWVTRQKSYLIDTILNKYPIPEVYMQETVNEYGETKYIIVDGQQRIRAILDFIDGKFNIDEKESPSFNGANFSDLSSEQKKAFFQYNFVVRLLPDISDAQLREIFQRLNKNVVALNKQELRQATYSGEFIKLMNSISDKEIFAKIGLFTPNDIRRMLDVEYISELTITILNGFQNKKDKLENFYQVYEDNFDETDDIKNCYDTVLSEIVKIIPNINQTRWCKKTDFFSLFMLFANNKEQLPLSKDQRMQANAILCKFGTDVTMHQKTTKPEGLTFSPDVENYAKGLRASTDLSSRRNRNTALVNLTKSIFE